MTETPWLKFYPSDWQGSAKLRSCSMAARGFAIELLSIMAAGDGHLLIAGAAPSDAELARLVGSTPGEVRRLKRELRARNIFAETEAGVWYSRRMLRDIGRRQVAREHGRKGGNPSLLRQPLTSVVSAPLNGGVKGEVKPQYQKPEIQKPDLVVPTVTDPSEHVRGAEAALRAAFEREFWPVYPRKVGKKAARVAWLKLRPSEELQAQIVAALKAQARSAEWAEPRFIPHACRWLSGERWQDERPPADERAALELKIAQGPPLRREDLERAEVHRRKIGRCPHEPECSTFDECVGELARGYRHQREHLKQQQGEEFQRVAAAV